jgi:hypothetical protein
MTFPSLPTTNMLIFCGIPLLVVWLCAATLVISILTTPVSVKLLDVTLTPAAPTDTSLVDFSVWTGWLAQLRQILALSVDSGPLTQSLSQRLSMDQWTTSADAQILLDFLVRMFLAKA